MAAPADDRLAFRQAWRERPLLAGALAGVIGAIAGIVGGIVFGIQMLMMMPNVLGDIGMLLGVPHLGFLVHLGFAAIIGLGFGLLFGGRALGWRSALGSGLLYGFAWWILGPLLIMPTWMGMGPMLAMALQPGMLMSLMGHLIYGLVTGVAYRVIVGAPIVERVAAEASGQ